MYRLCQFPKIFELPSKYTSFMRGLSVHYTLQENTVNHSGAKDQLEGETVFPMRFSFKSTFCWTQQRPCCQEDREFCENTSGAECA